MSHLNSISSSLHTDSDWGDDHSRRLSNQNNLFQTQECETLPTEKLKINIKKNQSSSSFEISSNPSINDEDFIEHDSIVSTGKIAEINIGLKKRYSNALIMFKAVSRPFAIRTKISLHDNERGPIQEFKDIDRNCPCNDSGKMLAWSLSKLKELKSNSNQNHLTLEAGLKSIEEAENEKNALKKRFEELSSELSKINSIKNSEKGCKCDCSVF